MKKNTCIQFRVAVRENGVREWKTAVVWASSRNDAKHSTLNTINSNLRDKHEARAFLYKFPLPRVTAEAVALLVSYAKDAGNWGGTPMIQHGHKPYGGDVKRQAGALIGLKKAGLCETFQDDRCEFLGFTDYGRDVCAFHGVYLDE